MFGGQLVGLSNTWVGSEHSQESKSELSSTSGRYVALVRYCMGVIGVLPGGIWPWFATVWG